MNQPNLDKLKSVLITSGLQIKDNPLYQVINGLINAIQQFQNITVNDISDINTIINNITNNVNNFNNSTNLGLLIDNENPEDSFNIPFNKRSVEFVTNRLISNTSLTIVPLAGSNLNVSLSTTGDFAVNTNQLYVDTSTGFVGINTTNPQDALEVYGFIDSRDNGFYTYQTASSGKRAVFESDNDLSAYIQMEIRGSAESGTSFGLPNASLAGIKAANSSALAIGTVTAQPLIFGTSNIEQMRLLSGGDFGIGVTPITRLHVVSPDATKAIIKIENSTNANISGFYSKAKTGGGSEQTWGIGILNRISSTDKGMLIWDVDNEKVSLYFLPNGGGIAVGHSNPTARWHLPAGTATASTAPLKFTSGTILTTAEAGAIEFNTDDFFATITTGAARKGIILDNGSRLTSGKIPVATTNGRLIDSTAALLTTANVANVVASTFEKAETGTDTNVLTYTTGAADEYLVAQVSTDVSALTGTSIVVTVTWQDSNNTTATSSITLSGVADGSINVPINVKTATNVVVSTVFVGVSTAYKISAFITRLK